MCKVLYEPSIEIEETQKGLDVPFLPRYGPRPNTIHLDWIHPNLTMGYDHPKIFYFEFVELAFLRFAVQLVFLKFLQRSPNQNSVFLQSFCKDKDIIQVNDDMSFIDFDSENLIHHSLEGGR